MDLQQLPEGCIANIISLTSPENACRLCLLGKLFKSAAESDAVWNKFLPPEAHTIISDSPELSAVKSKKELYLMLCLHPRLISEGKLSFSLDRWSGKKCYTICARELGIVWGDTPRYWRWTSHPESRFEEVAELLDVCWLEIHGKLDTRLLSPLTMYKAYLVFKFTRRSYGFQHLPVEVTIGLEGGQHSSQTVVLHNEAEMNYYERDMDYSEGESDDDQDEEEAGEAEVSEVDRFQRDIPGWLEIELGEFFCQGGEDGMLKMHCLANGGGHWKSGLIVQGIEVRPKRD